MLNLLRDKKVLIGATVDREIFIVKIFSSLTIATKIKHAKICHAMLYQLHGRVSQQ